MIRIGIHQAHRRAGRFPFAVRVIDEDLIEPRADLFEPSLLASALKMQHELMGNDRIGWDWGKLGPARILDCRSTICGTVSGWTIAEAHGREAAPRGGDGYGVASGLRSCCVAPAWRGVFFIGLGERLGAVSLLLLAARQLVKHFGPEPVLDGVDLEIRAGQRWAIVGPNGAGKSTLLRILAGELAADRGEVERAKQMRIGCLEQHLNFAPGTSVWAVARQGLASLIAMGEEAEQLAHALAGSTAETHDRIAARLDALHELLTIRDGYAIDHKIERVLEGLGFTPTQFQQTASSLSGGQQHRLWLAKLLLEDPDLLVLDEPTNHLDMESTQWLEEYLRGLDRAVLLVSHDRYFLDRTADHVGELLDGRLETFEGGWTSYLKQKGERLEVQRRTFERQQEEIAKLQEFIRKHLAGQKSTQAADRQKKLDRIERVEKPREIVPPPIRFAPPTRTGDWVLRCEALSKRYGERPLFHQLSWQVQRGERWAILGPNGAGKTTLLQCTLEGRVTPDSGRIKWGTGVRIGSLDQHLKEVDPTQPAIDVVQPGLGEWTLQARRDLLARFGISGDLAEQPVGTMSGGQRNRTLMARLAASSVNVLVLDEPTNHLDLWTRQALEEALLAWEGTVILISHDRYFVRRLATHILWLEAGKTKVFESGYDVFSQYHQATQRQASEQSLAAGPSGAADSGHASNPRSQGASASHASPPSSATTASQPRRKRKFPYRKVSDLEADIMDRETELEHLEGQLADPVVLRDGQRVRDIKESCEASRKMLETLYEHYREAVEMNS
jgi:ATP-binding cassette, subfamily F, member 3